LPPTLGGARETRRQHQRPPPWVYEVLMKAQGVPMGKVFAVSGCAIIFLTISLIFFIHFFKDVVPIFLDMDRLPWPTTRLPCQLLNAVST
jgi:hypothetical protein